MANIIVEAFPTESNFVYFIPSDHINQRRGKLYSAYKNYRTLLQDAELATKRRKIVKVPNNVAAATTILVLNEFEENSLDFVKNHTHPWWDVKDNWQKCRQSREIILNTYNTSEYFKIFPALSIANGYELVRFEIKKFIVDENLKLLFNSFCLILMKNIQ